MSTHGVFSNSDCDTGRREWNAADEVDLRRIRGQYLEMPGLCLTRCQAQRLWGLSSERCDALLGFLVYDQFLVVTRDQRFVARGH